MDTSWKAISRRFGSVRPRAAVGTVDPASTCGVRGAAGPGPYTCTSLSE